MQKESGEELCYYVVRSHKELLGAAFKACWIFGPDRTHEGPLSFRPCLGAENVASTLAGENKIVPNKGSETQRTTYRSGNATVQFINTVHPACKVHG